MLWFTSLARPLDLRLATNRIISALCAAALLAGTLYAWLEGRPGLSIIWGGASLALTAFLAWALARELDPDGEAGAFVPVALASAGWFALGDVDLWAMAVALLLCRMIARTVGPPALFGDALVALATVGGLAVLMGRWSFAIAGGLAFSLDALLSEGKRSRLAFASLAFGAAAVPWAVGTASLHAPAHPMSIAVVVAVGLGHLASLPRLRAQCDDREHQMSRERIRGAVAIALVLVLLGAVESGSQNPSVTVGVAATLVGTAIGRVLPRRRRDD